MMPTDITSPPPLVQQDPWLAPQTEAVWRRIERCQKTLARLQPLTGSISAGHHYFGFTRGDKDGLPGIWYREWAPRAKNLSLIGDFNGWQREMTPLTKDEHGVWHVFLPDARYVGKLGHGSQVKVHVHGADDSRRDRIPAYARRVVQDPEHGGWACEIWLPTPYTFRSAPPPPPAPAGLRIYEAHVGMAQEEPGVGTFSEFTDRILPRIKDGGYNAVQLMAIAEHPYYGSFGYHVSNFFAVSSRFGTPEELKSLIDQAHGMGLYVLLDLVHSHSVKNINEGLNSFDGTNHQYFHSPPRGEHPAWDSLTFDYGRDEVLSFLLSNVRFWLEEFNFDGFRFDGVTSMLYHDHGLSREFTSYDDYFSRNVDNDAVVFLQLVNQLTHALCPSALTIAEDVSGMPGLARPVEEGGLGFDYRLAMGIPDFWIKLLKERRDEDWNLGEIYSTLLNRRWSEKHVAYAESHDQSLVGDQALAFRLMDSTMYTDMGKHSDNYIVDRGIALHKLIRLLTFSLGGNAYLNFIGNEWGHPEWVDFPREGNGFSYHYARRQWSLVDSPDLRYQGLQTFDKAMLALDSDFHLLRDSLIETLTVHEEMRLLVYRRGPLVFVVNLHPTQSYSDLRVPVPDDRDYKLVLNSDDTAFGGFGRASVSRQQVYPVQHVPWHGRLQSVQLYLPSRSAQVLAPV